MSNWEIENKSDKVILKKSKNGSFNNFENAKNYAKKTAKSQKKILLIEQEESSEKDIDNSWDYTNALTYDEIYNKQESDVKIANAELVIAKIDKEKRKNELKISNQENLNNSKKRYFNSKQRVRKAKIVLKNAKRKLKEVEKQTNEF